MLSLQRSGYTADQVLRQLLHPARTLDFRYELLTANNQFKAHLGTVRTGNVANNALADIKRTARYTVREDGSINFLSDRIKPYVMLLMPDGNWIEWPKGVFLLASPTRKSATGSVLRDIEAYDQLLVLLEDQFEDRYVARAGSNVVQLVGQILTGAGITNQNLTAALEKNLPADREWEPDTPKLHIINDLLGAINYRSLFFDDDGYACAVPYVTPDLRAAECSYRDDQDSVILPFMEQTHDLFKIANKWIATVSEADRPPLRSVYTNTNRDSATSTVCRGRTIVRRVEVEAVDQATLDGIVRRLAFEDSQVYESVNFSTGIMPMHGDSDVFDLTYSKLGISAKYSEVEWSMELKVGGRMDHRIRRVVSV